MSSLVQTIGPAAEPITLAEAKEWLHVDGSEEDGLIVGLIEAARVHVENFTRRTLITTTYELTLDGFQCESSWGGHWNQIVLPRPPLQSVTSVKYYDLATVPVLQTFASTNYFVDLRSQPGRIALNNNFAWPEMASQPNAVVVTYVAGYGTPAAVPQTLRTAMRFMVSHWFENRVHINVGNTVNAIPDTVDALLWQHRIPALY